MSTHDEAADQDPDEAAGPGAVLWPAHVGDGGIHIGHQSGGANSTGEHGVAISISNKGSGPDAAHQRLLAAVADLRATLPRDGRGPEDEALDAELSAVEDEVNRSGRADRGRLGRLLGRVAPYGSATATTAATAASVATVIQAIAALLGG